MQLQLFSIISPNYLHCLNANSFFRLIGKTGGKRDTVVCCRLQITPVGIRDGLYQNDLICAGAVDCGIGDGVTDFQILDAADGVLGAPVMAAHADIAVPR